MGLRFILRYIASYYGRNRPLDLSIFLDLNPPIHQAGSLQVIDQFT
jgi:hypothetical protein